MIAPNNQDECEGVGGEHALIGVTKESRMERQAIREGWPIPNMATKLQLVEKQVKIALEGENREATTAFKAILAADALNSQVEPDDVPVGHTEGLDQRRASIASAIRGELSERGGARAAPNGSNGNGG